MRKIAGKIGEKVQSDTATEVSGVPLDMLDENLQWNGRENRHE